MDFDHGDAVYGIGDIAFADYQCALQHEIARLPSSLDFEAAATVALPGLDALQLLRDRARLSAGEDLLITGGRGGVSRFAVQIGRYLGARITVACSASHMSSYRILGADVVEFESAYDATYDVILQLGRSVPSDRYVEQLVPGGRLVVAGDVPVLRSGADLTTLAALITAGVVVPPASTPPEYT